MQDKLAIVKSVIADHISISGHLKLVGESVSDLEAIFSLEKAHTNWSQTPVEALAEKQKKIQQAICFLEEGLKNHFAFEERVLPPLFGEWLMQALIIEHGEIRKEIGEAKIVIENARMEGLNQRELLAKKSQMQEVISRSRQIIQEHAGKEEIILKMLERALEEKAKSTT